MQYGTVPGIDKKISRLVQGTASYNTDDLAQCFESLDIAYENGYTAFDTAQIYGPEKEKMMGQWIAERGIRDNVVILAKGAHHGENRHRVTPEDIETDMRATMAHMKLDYLDLYVLHRDDPSYPVGPIVEALNAHVKAGDIGAFGGSNWSYQRIQEANAYAKAHGLIPFAVSSPNFSLAEQVEEPWENCVSISGPQGEEARQYYAKEQIALFTWSSLAGGFFSDRFHRDNLETFGIDDYFGQLAIKCYCYEPNFQRLDRARELAHQKGLSVPQVALSFVMSQPLNIFALVFCADRAQFEANSQALEVKLTQAERDWLDLKTDTLA